MNGAATVATCRRLRRTNTRLDLPVLRKLQFSSDRSSAAAPLEHKNFYSTIMKKFSFKLKRLSDYSDDNLIAEIKRVCRLVSSGTLSTAEFQKHSKVGLTTVRRRFVSWKNALTISGFPHLYNTPTLSEKTQRQGAKAMDDEVLLQVIEVARTLGKETLTVNEFRDHSTISPDTVRRRFGSWNAALKRAGLQAKTHGRRYTEEECYENILLMWSTLGREPYYREMSAPPSKVGGKAYIVKWGTWNKALEAFVEYANSDQPAPPPTINGPKQRKQSVPVPERRDIPLGRRWKILKRSNYKCEKCGRSPANTANLELHVDHIVPWSKGGKTVIDNLRTLCNECNFGKGASIE